MSSSGLITKKFQNMTKDNKKQKLSDSTGTAIDYSTCYAQPYIALHNCDNSALMADMEDESVDVILTDPPYLYLKNQKLEREFDEEHFFKECYRVLTKNGFIVMFGRGTSFYRWNTILADLDFQFKEEVVWNKRYTSSPLLPMSRVHETISIHTKGNGTINRVKVPYLEMKRHDLASIIQDINRLKTILNNTKSLDAVLGFLELNKDNEKSAIRVDRENTKEACNYSVTKGKKNKEGNRCVAVSQQIQFGMNEKSIIEQTRDHFDTIHPTQKPIRLIERLLALVIPKEKEREDIVVADFFGGSFSTMEAVYNMGMRGIACEIDEEYFEAGKERIEKLQPRQMELFD